MAMPEIEKKEKEYINQGRQAIQNRLAATPIVSARTKTSVDKWGTQIGRHFGCGQSTVNRAVKAFPGKWEA